MKAGRSSSRHQSIADIALTPLVKRVDEEIAPDEMTAEKQPRVSDCLKSGQRAPDGPSAFGRLDGKPDIQPTTSSDDLTRWLERPQRVDIDAVSGKSAHVGVSSMSWMTPYMRC